MQTDPARDPAELSLLLELCGLGEAATARLLNGTPGIPGIPGGPGIAAIRGIGAALAAIRGLLEDANDPDRWLAAMDARHALEKAQADSQSSSPAETLDELNAIAGGLIQSRVEGVEGREALAGAGRSLRQLAGRAPAGDPVRDHLEAAAGLLEGLCAGTSADPAADFGAAAEKIDAAADLLQERCLAAPAAHPGRASSEPTPGPSPEPSSERQSEGAAIAHPPGSVQPAPTPAAVGAPPEANPIVAQAIGLPADADLSLLSDFVTECRDYIEQAEAALLALETDPEQLDAVNTVFRAFHTIKGTSGFLGIKTISGLAHRAESLLTRVRDREIVCTGGYADLALRSIDALKDLIEGVHAALGGEPLRTPEGYDDLLRVLADPEAAGVSAQSGNLLEPRLGDLLVAANKADRAAVESAAAGQGGDRIGLALVRSGAAKVTDVSQAIRTQGRIAGKTDAASDSSVRVRTDRLDRLIDMVGELVIAQSMVAQHEDIVGQRADLQRKVVHTGKIVRELQDLSMSMRMVPLKPTFQKLTRLVRDVAQKSGRKVDFATRGEETEIDRNMVDVIGDPLVHMIRNAVDHGIEPREERERAGKPGSGRVELAAYHAGGNVVVELRDDGRGLDRERIVRKAIDRGLIETDKGMADGDVYKLIFEPGFSTAEQVTDISGRGVGMDVVRRAIQSLHGRIEIHSAKGQGTTFLVKLPLTLAVTDGMLIRVGSQRFIIPTGSIHMSFRPDPATLSSVTGRAEMVLLRDRLVPIVRLHRIFRIENAVEEPTEALLVVVDDGGSRSALLVDELLGQQQVVAKSLGEAIGKIPGVAGGAILGDGRVGLILDPSGVVALARGGLTVEHGALNAAGESLGEPAGEPAGEIRALAA